VLDDDGSVEEKDEDFVSADDWLDGAGAGAEELGAIYMKQ
jgi:hypothetical protein